VFLFHGTSMRRAESILRHGFLARKTSWRRIYFSQLPEIAISYAQTRAALENDEPVLLLCSINLSQYTKHEWLYPVYHFSHRQIGSEVVVCAICLTGRDHLTSEELMDLANIPRISLHFNSSMGCVVYWVNTLVMAGKGPQIENHELAANVKNWLIEQANAGRSGEVPENELLRIVHGWY
jgi:hypothetical protein